MQIVEKKWTKMEQIDEGFKFLDAELASKGVGYTLDIAGLDAATGVGVVITNEEIDAAVNAAFDANMTEIMAQKYDFNFGPFLTKLRKQLMWGDGGYLRNSVDKKKLELLGEAPADDGTRKKKGKKSK